MTKHVPEPPLGTVVITPNRVWWKRFETGWMPVYEELLLPKTWAKLTDLPEGQFVELVIWGAPILPS